MLLSKIKYIESLLGSSFRFRRGANNYHNIITKHKRTLSSISNNEIELKSQYGRMKNASPYTSHFIYGTGIVTNTNHGITNTNDTNTSSNKNITVLEAIASILKEKTGETRNVNRNIQDIPIDDTLTSYELLTLGSIWFLPSEYLGTTRKPLRLTLDDSNRILNEGDYLRIHHAPRRFPIVHEYDWGKSITSSNSGVIISRNDTIGYIVINKPVGVSTNPTVDNNLECVVSAIQQSLNEEYVSIPQRLDQLTSGLLLLATKKSFASYFAKLLSNKTSHSLTDDTVVNNKLNGVRKTKKRKINKNENESKVHKKYKCLVCITSNDINHEIEQLKSWRSNKTIIKHYIESSFVSKKTFAKNYVNDNITNWSECLLRIAHVSDKVYPIYATNTNENDDEYAVAATLWNSHKNIPKNCKAVVELQIELLTGRTHQIRGQLSLEGFPIVGDVLYGGAISDHDDEYCTYSTYRNLTQSLALQCCQLSFVDPTDRFNASSSEQRKLHWNHFYLNDAWWTPFLDVYHRFSLI